MEVLVEISQFCFILEDMQDITPFWEWVKNRFGPEQIYTEPDELEAIEKGEKKLDVNKVLIIGEQRRDTDTFCIIPCTYQGQSLDVLDIDVNRLSDHRFKVEITFWDPDDWPKKALWEYFNNVMKDLSHDYPEVSTTLRNSVMGFMYLPLSNKQRLEMFGNGEDPDGNNSAFPNNGNRARKKPGRKHLSDDIWAYIEVNKKNREPSDVYKEWIVRPGVIVRNLQDSDRQFKLIIKPDWLWGNKS